jgi:diadenosine tetraphosphate (Ap4A) HIT family hydrolase
MGSKDECIFCDRELVEHALAENEYAFAIFDAYPVTRLHSLIVPGRHVSDYFELTHPEMIACHVLLKEVKLIIEGQDDSVRGFNAGVNSGEAAGQTVFHCHIHLIPRRSGDVPAPHGGIRNIIPGMGQYPAAE